MKYHLEYGILYLWEGRLAASAPVLASARALLSPDELTRADRFVTPRHRRRFAMARAQLRMVLGRLVGAAPETLSLTYAEHGKPLLDGGPSFNLSHSEEGVVIAVTREGRLGVDLEQHRPLRDMPALATRYFAADEAALVREAAPADRPEVFFRIWTRKEAFLKALGGGLSIPLRSFSVDPAAGGGASLLRTEGLGEDPATWHLGGLECAPGFTAALAVDRPGFKVARLGPIPGYPPQQPASGSTPVVAFEQIAPLV